MDNMLKNEKLTDGQKRVRLGFNPSGLLRIIVFKTMIANAIDYLGDMSKTVAAKADNTEKEDIGFFMREVATAQTLLQQAASMGVGAMTTDLAFTTLGAKQVTDPENVVITSGEYTKKPVAVKVITFEDFVEFGRKTTTNKNSEGFPLSFSFGGYAVSQETNNCYIIPTLEGNRNFTPSDVLITGVNGELYPCKIDIFKKIYTV